MNGNTLKGNAVSHPVYYNQHPSGIECIEIIRHYTCDIANALKYLWRAGLKPEMGKEDAEKEIEDLKKAIFYIEDYLHHGKPKMKHQSQSNSVERIIGHSIGSVLEGFAVDNISIAVGHLLYVGFICNGEVLAAGSWEDRLNDAVKHISKRTAEIRGHSR